MVQVMLEVLQQELLVVTVEVVVVVQVRLEVLEHQVQEVPVVME